MAGCRLSWILLVCESEKNAEGSSGTGFGRNFDETIRAAVQRSIRRSISKNRQMQPSFHKFGVHKFSVYKLPSRIHDNYSKFFIHIKYAIAYVTIHPHNQILRVKPFLISFNLSFAFPGDISASPPPPSNFNPFPFLRFHNSPPFGFFTVLNKWLPANLGRVAGESCIKVDTPNSVTP